MNRTVYHPLTSFHIQHPSTTIDSILKNSNRTLCHVSHLHFMGFQNLFGISPILLHFKRQKCLANLIVYGLLYLLACGIHKWRNIIVSLSDTVDSETNRIFVLTCIHSIILTIFTTKSQQFFSLSDK